MNLRAFQGRALTALMMALGFLVMAISGVVLFLAPNGRMARQMDWHLLGLDRGEWVDVHIVFGLLFIIVGLCHVWLNRKPLVSYMKQRQEIVGTMGGSKSIRWEWVVALLLCLALFAGAVKQLYPISTLGEWRDALKQP
ncbi:MAG: DUF4405 domain-containing protein [Alphaproteobacteria bacterium]|nr:DUF4405 domain-containing protein [Alphaproteobacteria bacterium]